MATLYSRSAGWRPAYWLAFFPKRAERAGRGKWMFRDVFGHIDRTTVAKRRQLRATSLVLAVALLGGCAATGGLSETSPDDVKRAAVSARAKARWDHLIKGDLAGAYEYMSPASRATLPLDLYKAKHKVGIYRAVEVDAVKCEADTCTVNLRVTYDYKRFKGVATPLVEKWVITQGQAWIVEQV